MPSLPAFSAHDCHFLRRYENSRIAFDRIPAEGQAYLRDIRTRLQSLARIAADDYHGKLTMTDFVSALYPGSRATSKYWAGIHSKQPGDERTSKSFQLQLAVVIMPEGFEICFYRGAGKSLAAPTDKLAGAEPKLTAVQSALANLRVQQIARIERTLQPYWFFRKHGMNPNPRQEFSTLTQWLDYAASDAGARASISMFIGEDELENNKIDVSAMFLEAVRLFEPLFEAVYGAAVENGSPPTEWLEPSGIVEASIDEPPLRDLKAICDDFATGLREANLVLGTHHDENVKAFVASLTTKRFLILTGLSGSGKTQLALRFGDWLGIDRVRVTPVRPDWTGAEALFGYEDALQPMRDGARAWHVPEALEFMLRAANDPDKPYLLILDEMNLAHVERYFADFLSGMETLQPCLPNLERYDDGLYRISPGTEPRLPMPANLFVVGTVNIDETTYLFSPKVLDRANTIDFKVRTEDLQLDYQKPGPCKPGSNAMIRGFLAISTDERYHVDHPAPKQAEFAHGLRRVHRILAEHNLEFGHRVFYEATRFSAMFAAAGHMNPHAALDRQIMHKVLPRLHGSRRKLELALCSLAAECLDPESVELDAMSSRFDPLAPMAGPVRMPLSFDKIQRMVRALRMNQFTSFSE
ncbi:MAG: hypothetical protein IPM54_45640 [Polyangiaceae bacterium]|nr:hypothetical protein [Polyangiaceae bacterium]